MSDFCASTGLSVSTASWYCFVGLEARGVPVSVRRRAEVPERAVRVAQILLRLRVERRRARDLLEGLGRLGVLALRVERLAQLELRVGVGGVERDGAPVGFGRAVSVARGGVLRA